MKKTVLISIILLILTVVTLLAMLIVHKLTKKDSLELDETIELNIENFTKRETIIQVEIENEQYDAFVIENGFFDDVKNECEEKDGKLAWNRAKKISHWIEIGNKTNFDDANFREVYDKVCLIFYSLNLFFIKVHGSL